MAGFSLIAHASVLGSGLAVVTTPPIDTTAATVLVSVLAVYGTTSTTVDSLGNTWTVGLDLPGSPGINMCYCIAPIVGPGQTFSFSGAYGSACVLAFGGVNPVLFDQVSSASAAAYATSLATGAITPKASNALLVTGLSVLTSSPFTIDSGFTVTDQVDFAGGDSMGVAGAYRVLPSPAAANPTWSFSINAYPTFAAMLSFVPGGVSGSVVDLAGNFSV